MRSRRFWIRIPIAIFVALFLAIAAGEARAQQEGDFAPANAEKTLGRLRWVCMIGALCPLSSDSYKTLKQAIAGDRNAQYLWGLTLLTGNGAPSDRPAGMQTGWRQPNQNSGCGGLKVQVGVKAFVRVTPYGAVVCRVHSHHSSCVHAGLHRARKRGRV